VTHWPEASSYSIQEVRSGTRCSRAAAEAAFEKGQLSADLPTVELPRDEVIGAMIAAVTTKAGLSGSNGEARRLAQGGGLRLNDEVVNDGARLIEEADLNADGVLKLAQLVGPAAVVLDDAIGDVHARLRGIGGHRRTGTEACRVTLW